MADHEALKELATAVVNDLSEASKAVATAESCSGGWVAKAITDVPGSSACFGYGVVSYSNGAKESILGVENATLGTDEKPVGTVWFAWAVRDHSKIRMETACQQFDGDREAIRELTVAYALQGVLERIRP